MKFARLKQEMETHLTMLDMRYFLATWFLQENANPLLFKCFHSCLDMWRYKCKL